MVTDTENIRKLAEDLEKQELDVSSYTYNRTAVGHVDLMGVISSTLLLQALGGSPTSQVYAQLLAIYLYQNDLYV